jgi:hypothetical protein
MRTTAQIMLIAVLLVAKNAVFQGYPVRELHAAPQPVIIVDYGYIWALVRIGTSLGTRAVQEVVHSCGMSSVGLRRIDPVWPRSSRFGHYRLHDCTATFRNTRAVCKPQTPAQAANQLLRVCLIFSRKFYSSLNDKGTKVILTVN